MTAHRMKAEVAHVLAQPQRLAAMGQAALTLARPNAAAELADAVAALAQRRLPASERQSLPLSGR